MTDQPSAFDFGIKCMPSENSTFGLPQDLVKSSDEILTELFGSLNAKPPASLESLDRPRPTPTNTSNEQNHKKNKHKHLSHKHKRKPKSKKNKRHKRMSSVTRKECKPSPMPKDISDNSSSRPASVNSEVTCFDPNSKPLCAVEDTCVNIGLPIVINQEESSKNSCSEMEVIQQETGLGLELQHNRLSPDVVFLGCTPSRPSSQDSFSINTSVDTGTDVHMIMDKNADECLQTEAVATSTKESSDNTVLANLPTETSTSTLIDLEKIKEFGLSLSQSVSDTTNTELAISPVISCVGLETRKEHNRSFEPIYEMVKQHQSKSGSRDRSKSPENNLKRSKECSPEHVGQKRSSKGLKHRNKSNSPEIDHHHKKNAKGNTAKNGNHGNRKKRSRSRDVEHESKDRKRRSRSVEKTAYCNDRKNNRSCSRDRSTHIGDKKRRSKSCDIRIHHEINHNKGRDGSGYHRNIKGKGKRSISRDRKKRSISRERSSDRKNTKKRKGRSVSKDKKPGRKSQDRSRSKDRKRSISADRENNRRQKSKSLNRSAEKNIVNVIRESSTSRSKSEAGEGHLQNPIEEITIADTVNPSNMEECLSRSKDIDVPRSDQSVIPSIDNIEHQDESPAQVSLQIESKDNLSQDLDSYQSKKKYQSNNHDDDKRKINKKKSHGNYRKSRSKSPIRNSQQRDRKRRSKSTDSHSHPIRPKRKSRSRSHNKDCKQNDKRRRTKSKDDDVRRSDRKSRSRHKSNRIKKEKSKDKDNHNKKTTRSKSKDAEGHSSNRKSRSKSREKEKSSHRTDKRSRSNSPDRTRRNIRKKRSRSREVHIDKRKLFEIARKNAMSMLKQAAAPFCTENIVTIKAGGKSVEELTDFCKQLSKKEAGALTDSDGDETHHSDSDIERPFHHPFQLKERPTNIVLNIRNSVSVPTKTFQEKTAEQSKQLRLQFPVSSGQNHRKTESEWVPVASGQSSTSVQPSLGTNQPSQPGGQTLTQPVSTAISTAVPSTVLAVAQTDSQSSSSVFPPAPASPPDIGNIVEKRVNAMRKLTTNPNDSHAISQIYQVNQQMSMWLASKQQPGQFTGSTGAKVLTAAQLSTGYQAWTKKDQLMTAAPVSGGMGMALLQKMGWRPGEGLGKNKEGSLEPLSLEVKMDKKGLVAQEELSKKHQSSSRLTQKTTTLAGKHPVSLLVEFCSKRHWDSPQFHVCFECGPDHKKNFLFKVRVNGIEYQPSVASNNKKQAKAEAARLCLQTLGLLYPDAPK